MREFKKRLKGLSKKEKKNIISLCYEKQKMKKDQE
jgi:hypothetical protein